MKNYVASLLTFLKKSILVPIAFFRYKGEKEAQEHFKQIIKICPDRVHIFRNKLRYMWAAILKTSVDTQSTNNINIKTTRHRVIGDGWIWEEISLMNAC